MVGYVEKKILSGFGEPVLKNSLAIIFPDEGCRTTSPHTYAYALGYDLIHIIMNNS